MTQSNTHTQKKLIPRRN